MTEFMRPTVTTEEVNDLVARFIVEPLERGYGYTLGNCMRRVLLSSLDGAKATAIQIDGVQHEFTTAEGVIEDITDIVLNVKGLVFSALNSDVVEATAHVHAEGPCTVTGADLDVPTEFTLINKLQISCYNAVVRSADCHCTYVAAVINNRTYGCPGRSYLCDNTNKPFACNYVIINVDTIITALVDHKGIIPVPRIFGNDTRCNFWIVGVFLIQIIKFLQSGKFSLILDQDVILLSEAVDLIFKILIFLKHILFITETILYIPKHVADT